MISEFYFKQSQVKLEQAKWNYPMTTDSEHTFLKNKHFVKVKIQINVITSS